MKKSITLLAIAVWIIAIVPSLAFSQSDEAKENRAQSIRPDKEDISRPLREIAPKRPQSTNPDHEVKRLPAQTTNGKDQLAAQSVALSAATINSGLGFDGLGIGSPYTPNAAPPDTNGSVGATQYVQWVNEAFAVYSKANGSLLYGPAAGNTLWSGFGGPCESFNDGDPIAQYDKAANRWVMTQFAVSTQPYTQCLAVSDTSDATGTYHRYSFSYGTSFNDYPKLGVWPDGYYLTYNMFRNGATFIGSDVCAVDRDAILGNAARPVTQQCVQLSSSFGGLLPSDLDGSIAPPPGSPNFVLNFGTNALRLWKFHVDWSVPANSTLTGPTSIPVSSFSTACGGGTCIPQSGTSQKLDSLADRLMYRLAYRRFADGHEALLVNHSVLAGGGSGARWYELRNPSGNTMSAGTPVVFQQGTFAPDTLYRWMGSAAMDSTGNIALGYSVSSSGMFPAIRFTGRDPADPLGTMSAETAIMNGGGSQLSNLSRWGDYSNLSVDPVDDCTMWYTTEYLKNNGTFNWSTRISSFKFATCGSTGNVPPTVSITAPADGAQFTAGANLTVSANAADTAPGTVTKVDFYAGANPIGTDTTSPYSITWSNVAAGSYSLTAVATDNQGATTTSTAVGITVSNPTGGITLTASGQKAKGLQIANLTWTGATKTTVDLYRNGVLLTNTPNDGSYTDNINARGSGTYTYRVCEAGGTSVCSNTASVVF